MKKALLLLVSLITFNCFSQCEKITRKTDKFTGEITLHSPIGMYMSMAGHFYKSITKDTTNYSLYLHTCGSTITKAKGVVILFEDGSKLEFPNQEIEADVPQGNEYCNFEYQAFIDLSKSDIDKLLTHKMTDFRLYIFDRKVGNAQAKKLQDYLRCLVNTR
jgi:hypothetical protein